MTAARLMVFDLDGTLVDSLPDIVAAVNRLLARRGLPALGRADVGPMVGDGLHPLIARVFAAFGREPDDGAAAEYLADYEARVAEATVLFPGMADALAGLTARGWRLAVCTNKPERAARLLLAALGVEGVFAAVTGGDTLGVKKPDPGHLLGTIAAAGGVPALSLMLGDHANDVRAAEGARVRALFAGWGYGNPRMAAGASAVCAEPRDVPAMAEWLLRA